MSVALEEKQKRNLAFVQQEGKNEYCLLRHLVRITSFKDAYQYPLTFVDGEGGCHSNIILTNLKAASTKQFPSWTSISKRILQLFPPCDKL